MNAPFPIRSKLALAALALVLACAFCNLHDFREIGGWELAIRVALIVFSAFIAFTGVFWSGLLQLLWGWCLAVAVPALAVLCVTKYRGFELVSGSITLVAAAVGCFLLLCDSSVRAFRVTMKNRLQVRKTAELNMKLK